MPSKMYRHRKYAGSPGDVWKHLIFMDLLLNFDDTTSRIIDAHGGDGYYPLHYGASWKRGFAAIDEKHLEQSTLSSHPYFVIQKSFFNRNYYLGFWALFNELAKSSKHAHNLDVYEIQTEVFDDMKKYCKKFGSLDNLNVVNMSYEEADLSRYNLAFIDPTYRRKDDQGDDWKKVANLCNKLRENDCEYAVWYPVYNKNISFRLWDELECMSLETQWIANENFKFASSGSGILISPRLFSKIKHKLKQYDELAKLLNAKFITHNIT